MGTRGTFEENTKAHGTEGVYINGFYETQNIHYEESAYGFATESQTMLNLPNGKVLYIFLEDEAFSLDDGTILSYKRRLDFKKGVAEREIHWCSPKGKEVLIKTSRLVSFSRKHIMAARCSITPLNGNFSVKIISTIDGNVSNVSKENDPRIGSSLNGICFDVKQHGYDGDTAWMAIETKNSHKRCCIAMFNKINIPCEKNTVDDKLFLAAEYTAFAEKEQVIVFDKTLAYYAEDEDNLDDMVKQTKEILHHAALEGYERLASEQEQYLAEYWDRADIQIMGADNILQGLRFNLFHLLQHTGKDGKAGVSAKGLSGEGYEGHYFWESETYIMPAFMFSSPDIAKSILTYRYGTLDKARENAAMMGHRGAMFPWRTINGYECSAYFPAGAAQYHITGGVAYAVKRYFEATDDINFICSCGAEILLETARFWLDIGHFNQRKDGRFCIDCVTGPDEYTAIVNNNCYTNIIAAENLIFAADMHDMLKEQFPGQYLALRHKINLTEDESTAWRKAGENIYLPYDETLGIYKQDDSFLDKKRWDFENTPAENYPLLMHYHPLVIYRHQVSKQPDLLLIEFLARNRFDMAQIKRDYDYYSKVITHDSSLSESVFSIIACLVEDYDKACQYFADVVRLDLDNTHGNTKDGLHMANLAGAWGAVIYGFAGLNIKDGIMEFKPYMPAGWDGYAFKLRFMGRVIQVSIDKTGASFALLEGEPLEILCDGEKRRLTI